MTQLAVCCATCDERSTQLLVLGVFTVDFVAVLPHCLPPPLVLGAKVVSLGL